MAWTAEHEGNPVGLVWSVVPETPLIDEEGS